MLVPGDRIASRAVRRHRDRRSSSSDDAPSVEQQRDVGGGASSARWPALLEGLRALGSGRVLDEVLALVLDSAIEVTGAERGFIMLANRGARSSSSWRARAAR